ncbi:MAG: hypothetical protein DRI90_17655 [Deltaproteobacteria bacterium]|nr:MAG: hypothetical protein DRI90_17655 [Deltaproteobacteria bacterium]
MTPTTRFARASLAIFWIVSSPTACDASPDHRGSISSTGTQPADRGARTATGDLTGTNAAKPPKPSPLETLEPKNSALPGSFMGTTGTGQPFVVTVATKGNPRPYRRPLAFYRLALALDYDQAPVTELRRLGTGEVSRLLGSHPVARQILTSRARVTNDGTIAALLVGHVPGVDANLADNQRLARCAKLAASSDPLPQTDATYVGDYVRLLVLDYLAANVERRSLRVDEQAHRVRAVDNSTAFPGYVAPEALDIPLGRLEPVVRFPRDLKTTLQRLDRKAFKEQLVRGRFEDLLIGPRQLAGLVERRATLLSLLESRLLQYGDKVVLSL